MVARVAIGLYIIFEHPRYRGFMATTPESLQQHSWQLIEISTNGTLQSIPDNASVTLQFEGESRVHGKSGCNRYFASYTLDGSCLSFGQAGATRMMCPEPLMKLESEYFAALEHVESYQAENEQLTLLDRQGKRLLLFQRVGA